MVLLRYARVTAAYLASWLLIAPFACSGSDSDSAPAACEGVAIGFGACECKAGETPIEPVAECSEATMGPGTLCCEGSDGCFCARIGCAPSGSMCFCDFASSGSASCTGAPCCTVTGEHAGQCRCGLACGADEKEVAECTNDVLECATGKTRVPKCTPK